MCFSDFAEGGEHDIDATVFLFHDCIETATLPSSLFDMPISRFVTAFLLTVGEYREFVGDLAVR